MKTMKLILIIMLISFAIASLWNKIPIIKDSVHFILDPTAGSLLNWNITYGMFIVVMIISLIVTLIQKYGTDQETLREIKKEQKIIQEEMKKYKHDPERLFEFNKKQMEIIPKTFDITLKPIIYTAIPFILFFRWFNDYFSAVNWKFLGILSWFWFYFIFSIVFSSIFRKVLKVA